MRKKISKILELFENAPHVTLDLMPVEGVHVRPDLETAIEAVYRHPDGSVPIPFSLSYKEIDEATQDEDGLKIGEHHFQFFNFEPIEVTLPAPDHAAIAFSFLERYLPDFGANRDLTDVDVVTRILDGEADMDDRAIQIESELAEGFPNGYPYAEERTNLLLLLQDRYMLRAYERAVCNFLENSENTLHRVVGDLFALRDALTEKRSDISEILDLIIKGQPWSPSAIEGRFTRAIVGEDHNRVTVQHDSLTGRIEWRRAHREPWLDPYGESQHSDS